MQSFLFVFNHRGLNSPGLLHFSSITYTSHVLQKMMTEFRYVLFFLDYEVKVESLQNEIGDLKRQNEELKGKFRDSN